jgi:hypothetical protein
MQERGADSRIDVTRSIFYCPERIDPDNHFDINLIITLPLSCRKNAAACRSMQINVRGVIPL